MKEVIPNIAEISMINNFILRIKFLPKTNIGVEAAKKIVDASKRVSQNLKHCNLVDTRDMLFMDRDARKYFAEQDRSEIVAVGVVIHSKFQKALSNLYLKVSKPILPTKMFHDEDDAIVWLNSMMG